MPSQKIGCVARTEGRQIRLLTFLPSLSAVCYGWTTEYCLNVLGLDMAQLQILCVNRYTERLMEHMPTIVGPVTSSRQFLTSLLANPLLHPIYITIGIRRVGIARHVLALFINAVQHARMHRRVDGGVPSPLHLVQSIPSMQLCSLLVMASHALSEEIDGSHTAGHRPYDSVGDPTMEITEILLQSTSRALLQLANLEGASESVIRDAVQQGNLFVFSARLIESLIRRLRAWRAEHGRGSRPSSPPQQDMTLNEAPYPWEDLTPDAFDNLFREFLSEPFKYF